MTRDLRTLLNLKLREECSDCTGIQLGLQADACNRGAAVEADAIGRAAVETDTIGEQQLKRTQSGGKWTQSGSNSSAQRAVRCHRKSDPGLYRSGRNDPLAERIRRNESASKIDPSPV